MIEKLSSSLTFWHKFLFPAIWITGFGIGTISLWTTSDDSSMKWDFLCVWLVGSSFLLWHAILLKKVTLHNDHLIVQNYFSENIVPISNIKEVTQSWFVHPPIVKLMLDPPCEFGDKIVFIPRFKVNLRVWGNPITEQLRQLVKNQRENATGYSTRWR